MAEGEYTKRKRLRAWPETHQARLIRTEKLLAGRRRGIGQSVEKSAVCSASGEEMGREGQALCDETTQYLTEENNGPSTTDTFTYAFHSIGKKT